jgi:hypothetical protein
VGVTGATTSRSNGGPPRLVDRSPRYRQQLEALKQFAPRIDRVDEAQEQQLAHNAENGGVRIAGNAWVRETVPGKDAPKLFIIYSITECHVLMEQIHLAEQDPDEPLPY